MNNTSQELIVPEEKTRCIECRFEIPIGAKKCTFCTSYQSKWKNRLKYISSVIGVTTASIAILAYLVTTIPKVRSVLFWNEHVEVIEFRSLDRLTVANTGDGPVFITHLSIVSDPSVLALSMTWPVGMTLSEGTVATIPVWDQELRLSAEFNITKGLSDEEWKIALSKTGPRGTGKGKACYVFSVMAESDPLLQMYQANMGKKYRTFPVEAAVHYYSPKRRSKVKDSFKAVVGLLTNPDIACTDSALIQ